MHNLNLLNYYDKSLADVNKELAELVLKRQPDVVRVFPLKKVLISLSVLLVVAIFVAYYVGFFGTKTVAPIIEAEPPPDLRTEEEKLGYVQIQIFEFDENMPNIENKPQPINKDNASDDEGTKAKQEALKKKEIVKNPTTEAAAIKKPTPQQAKQAVPEKEYSILFEDVNERQYSRIRRLNANRNVEILNSTSNTFSIWKVYEKLPNGENQHREDFLTQNDAMEYAKSSNIDALIQQVSNTDKTYNVRICCTSLDIAKRIAQDANIEDRIIKIVRER